jgi:hypothetical protein
MRAFGWNGTFFNESEMALFSECMLQCARNRLDTADIVRDACFQLLSGLKGAGKQVEPGQSESPRSIRLNR